MILTEKKLKLTKALLPSSSSTPLPHTPSPNPPLFKVESYPQARIMQSLLNLHILNLFCSMPSWSYRFTSSIMEGLGTSTTFAIHFSVTKVKEQQKNYLYEVFSSLPVLSSSSSLWSERWQWRTLSWSSNLVSLICLRIWNSAIIWARDKMGGLVYPCQKAHINSDG